MAKQSALSYVLRAKNRMKVLNALENDRKISAQLEKETGMYKSHMNRTLKELQEKKLVICINPKDRSFKFYELSHEGKKILVQARKILEQLGRNA